jgi:secreted trypsin-like serine protease
MMSLRLFLVLIAAATVALSEGRLLGDASNDADQGSRQTSSSSSAATSTYNEALYDGMTLTTTSSNTSSSRIVNGGLAVGDFPSFAIADGRFLCGSTLIWPDMIVTTANCLGAYDVFSFVSAYIGGTRLDFANSDAPEIIDLESSIVHPDYESAPNSDNILILRLARRSQAANSPWNTNPDFPAVGDEMVTIGHGRTTDAAGSLSNDLRQAVVSAVSNQECDDAYTNPINTVDTFCARNVTSAAPCNGDGGGPVFDNKGVLIGMNAFGPATLPCGALPSGFTRMSAQNDWILNVICKFSEVRPRDKQFCCRERNCNFLGIFRGYFMSRNRNSGECRQRCAMNPRRLARSGWECGPCP